MRSQGELHQIHAKCQHIQVMEILAQRDDGILSKLYQSGKRLTATHVGCDKTGYITQLIYILRIPLLGGFIRTTVPEMIRTTAPLYLKTGGSVAKTHGWDTTAIEAKQRAKQVGLVKRVIERYYSEAISSPKGSIH